MRYDPLTFDQAADLCIEYQHLKGKALLKDATGEHSIDCIAIAPFDDLNKYIFAQFYKEYGCPLQALTYYQYVEYDVLLIAHRYEQKMIYKDLRTYLTDLNKEKAVTM